MRAAKMLGFGVVAAAAGYCIWAAVAWYRYGRPNQSVAREEADPLLERFMPTYEVVERHQTGVDAPASETFSAACEMDPQDSGIVRAIFRTRELLLGSKPQARRLPAGLLAQMKALGWGVLAEIPEREILMGAVTRPWDAEVIFRPVAPEDFADFNEPAFVKIAWTLRADPAALDRSVFRTETRAAATDAAARQKFRLYWSFFSPGISLIRRLSLRPLKAEAERRARQSGRMNHNLQ